jgi:hypothetical protein
MDIEHRKAAAGITIVVGMLVSLACAAALKLVPWAEWAIVFCVLVTVPASIYIARLWHRHFLYVQVVATARRLLMAPPELYITRETRPLLRDEPEMYVAIATIGKEQRFSGFDMYTKAAPAFIGQNFVAATDDYMTTFVRELLPLIEHASAEESRSLVARTMDAAQKHGNSTTFIYFDRLGPAFALDALEQGISLEYAQTMAV